MIILFLVSFPLVHFLSSVTLLLGRVSSAILWPWRFLAFSGYQIRVDLEVHRVSHATSVNHESMGALAHPVVDIFLWYCIPLCVQLNL